MACEKNPRKFLWWEWFGDHDWVHSHGSSWCWYSDYWDDQYGYIHTVFPEMRQCSLCGLKQEKTYKIYRFSPKTKDKIVFGGFVDITEDSQ